MIRESGDTVSFLVVDKETDVHFKSRGIPITCALIAMRGEEPKPEPEAEPEPTGPPPKARLVRFRKAKG